jgi:hypothetical protein
VAALAALLGLAACMDRPALFEPAEGGAAVLRLPAGELAFYESDTLRVAVEDAPAGARVQLLLLDPARAVLWRSALVPIAGGAANVPVEEIPAAVTRGAALLLTGTVADAEGRRLYASDDSAAVASLAQAATRTVRVWAGRRVRAGDGGTPPDLAAAPELGRVFFPVPEAGAVGVLELSGDGRLGGTFPAGVRPERVAYRAGVLAALGAGGGEISFMRADAAGTSPPSSALLPALELELDTTFLGAVRPVGRALALGCTAAACAEVFAAVPSGVQVLEGTVAQPGTAGVLRVVGARVDGGVDAPLPRLVLPGFTDALRGDTSAAAAVFAPAAPSGGRELLQRRDAVSACLSTALGGSRLAAGSDGVVFVAGAGPACGPGTSILRIEAAPGDDAAASALAIRNTQAEDRLGTVLDLQLSDDGAALLVLGEDGVAVLDPYLRVRGTLTVAGARAVAWLRGGAGERFVVDPVVRVPPRGAGASGGPPPRLTDEERLRMLPATIAGDALLSLQHQGLDRDPAAVEQALRQGREHFAAEVARSGAGERTAELLALYDTASATARRQFLEGA